MSSEEDLLLKMEKLRRERILVILLFLSLMLGASYIISWAAGGSIDTGPHALYTYENGIPNSDNQFFCNFSIFLNHFAVKFTIIALIVVILLVLSTKPDFERWLYLTITAILGMALLVGMVNSVMTPANIIKYCFIN